jgi:peptidoglycan L-alanyl-D-glutamate endopeptidase CwlK
MKKEHDIRIDRTLLHPRLDKKLGLLLKACGKQGIYLIITEGFRTKEYQDSLYEQGRTKPGNIVTNVKGSTYGSQHMWGIAFDIAINDKKLLYDEATIRKVAKTAKSAKINLGWGGDWTNFVDTPHFYLKKWGSTTAKLKSRYGTPEKFKKTWK